MSRYTLIGYDGKILDVVESATWMEAERSARAQGVRVLVAREYRPEDDGSDVSRGTDAGAALLEDAEARLSEAFRRLGISGGERDRRAVRGRRGDVLTEGATGIREEDADARLGEALGRGFGLSERESAQAVAGRDSSSTERARRVEALTEAGDGLRGDRKPAGAYFRGKRLPDGMTMTRVSRDATERSRRLGQIDVWGGQSQTLELQAKEAEIAGTLVRAGYDPNDVARALGIPVRHTGSPPVTVQANRAPTPTQPEQVAATEAARTWGDSELVPLVEVGRLEAALTRGFGLSEAEARHAGKGR